MFSVFDKITTPQQLSSSITGAYLFDIVIAAAGILLLVLVANMIKFDLGKNDQSGLRRRRCFFIIGALVMIGSAAFDYLIVAGHIMQPAWVSKFLPHVVFASVLAGVVYFAVSFLIVKMAPRGSKLESIFPKK